MKRQLQIYLLILAAGSIYPLLYMRKSFQNSILEVFNINVTELSELYALLGLMFIFGYAPSGWISDRINNKTLIIFSMIATGLIGLYFGTIPPKHTLIYIFFTWGLTTVFTFWSALLKAIKMLAKPEEQAKTFGLLDGGRGLVEAILGTTAILIFTYIVNSTNSTKDALISIINMYSITCILLAGVMFFFLDSKTKAYSEDGSEDNSENQNNQNSNFLTDLKNILKIKQIWLVSGIIFCGYTIYWTVYYISGYLEVNHNVSPILAGSITTAMLWMRPVGGIIGGIIGDKFGKYKVFSIIIILSVISVVLLVAIPSGSSNLMLWASVLFLGVMVYGIRGLYWSFLDDCKIPVSILGLAIGIISFFGYMPDFILPKISEYIFQKYSDGPDAYKVYLMVSAAVGLLTLVFIYLLFKVNNKANKLDNNQKEIIIEKEEIFA